MKKYSTPLFLVLILFTELSYAYIDPGSGSAIMSAIIGFIIATGLAAKAYWYKIKSMFKKKKKDSDEDGTDTL